MTGRDGGRDLDLRVFARDGMRLHGRLRDITGSTAHFAQDLKQNLDGADAVMEGIKDLIDAYIERAGLNQPTEQRYTPVWEPEAQMTQQVDLIDSGITSVVWSTGFDADYRWVNLPVFDGRGYPTHHRGVTSMPGLYVLGLPWQWTWGSGRFRGVGEDARYLTEQILRTAQSTLQVA